MEWVNIDRACAGISLFWHFRSFPHEEELDMLMPCYDNPDMQCKWKKKVGKQQIQESVQQPPGSTNQSNNYCTMLLKFNQYNHESLAISILLAYYSLLLARSSPPLGIYLRVSQEYAWVRFACMGDVAPVRRTPCHVIDPVTVSSFVLFPCSEKRSQ